MRCAVITAIHSCDACGAWVYSRLLVFQVGVSLFDIQINSLWVWLVNLRARPDYRR